MLKNRTPEQARRAMALRAKYEALRRAPLMPAWRLPVERALLRMAAWNAILLAAIFHVKRPGRA